MAVIGIDSSGIIRDPPEPIWMAAVRKANVQKHNILYLSVAECQRYRKEISLNWREKLAASLAFKSMRPLIQHFDIVQIDNDFQGRRREFVEAYLYDLFGHEFSAKSPLCKPKIQFIPEDFSEDVKRAHNKSWKARHKSIDCIYDCPDLEKLLGYLE